MPTFGGSRGLELALLAAERVVDAQARARRVSSTGGRRSAHGRSASICAASESSVPSSSRRPTSWAAERQAVAGEAGRHRGGGLAGHVPGRAVGDQAGGLGDRARRAAPLPRARETGGSVGHAGVSSTSWSSNTLPIRSARAASAPRRAVDQRAAETSEPRRATSRGAPLEPLGAREPFGVVVDPAQPARHEQRQQSPVGGVPLARRRGRASAAGPPSRRPRARTSAVTNAAGAGGATDRAMRSRPGGVRADSAKGARAAAACRRRRRRSGHRVEEQRRVHHGAGHRPATLRPYQCSASGHERHAAALGLEPEQAAARRGDPDRAAAVGGGRPARPARPPPRRPSRRSSRRACAGCPTGCG